MDQYLDIISKCSLFKNFSYEEIKEILKSVNAYTNKYKKGEYVLTENDKPLEFGILLEGSINIQKLDFEGNLNITSNIKPSHLFAEAFVYSDIPKILVNVICTADSNILFLSKEQSINLIHDNPELYKKLTDNMLNSMSKKLVHLNKKIDILTKQSIREKVLAYLDTFICNSDKVVFDIPFNREQLADFLCVNRASLSRELSKMKKEGIIDFHKNTFKIL